MNTEEWIEWRNANPTLWQTLDGRILEISKMDAGHIFNILRKFKEHIFKSEETYLNLLNRLEIILNES